MNICVYICESHYGFAEPCMVNADVCICVCNIVDFVNQL